MPAPSTIKTLIQYLTGELGKIHPAGEAGAMANLIVRHIFHLSHIKMLQNPDYPVNPATWSKVKDILSELKQRKPIQYIIGYTEFYEHTIMLSPAVLIPRPETEELVQWVLESSVKEKRPLKILDVGTGSGCIAIALAAALPEAEVSGCDNSSDALEIADKNAALNKVNITFFRMDILNSGEITAHGTYYYIVSNPPYIPDTDKPAIQPEVLMFEPGDALFVPAGDPLIFYRAILRFAGTTLLQGGKIFFETHHGFAPSVAGLCRAFGYSNVEIRKDINGKERMIKAVKT